MRIEVLFIQEFFIESGMKSAVCCFMRKGKGRDDLKLLLAFLSVLGFLFSNSAQACGNGGICNLENDRHYRIRFPDNHDGKKSLGAIFFAHGLGGSSKGIIDNQNLIRLSNRLGIALVALKAKREDWNVKNSPSGRSDRTSDEDQYLKTVIRDVTGRFSIDRKRLMLAGVSVGGTFTWTMACTGKTHFAAYMPISGTYWLNPPKSCSNAPKNIIHVHGTADRTVPITGRRVGSSAHSNVLQLINAYSRIGDYSTVNKVNTGGLRCSNQKNLNGNILEFCLHDGGHQFRTKDIEYAWRRFQKLGIL